MTYERENDEIYYHQMPNSRLQIYVEESKAELAKMAAIEKSTIEHMKDMIDKSGLQDTHLMRSHWESWMRDSIQDIFADLKAKHESDAEEKRRHMTEECR